MKSDPLYELPLSGDTSNTWESGITLCENRHVCAVELMTVDWLGASMQ